MKMRQQCGILTLDESALAVGDRGHVGAEGTEATFSASGRDEVQRRGAVGVETPASITAVSSLLQFVGHDVTIAGYLASGGGADMVAVPVDLYNTDDPSNKARTASTVTDSSGRYQFIVTDSVATTHADILSAEGRRKNNRARVKCL
jgi:hypothetical protein